MIGTWVGPYEIRAELGRGGMAAVYRAYQPAVDREVAIKIIHAARADDEALRERFRREARLIARLEHPGIVPIYDFDGAHDPPYIVMRHLDGGTLRELLATRRLPLDAAVALLGQVAAALDYAHAQGVVHRDIKPSNILLDRHGHALVSDFGIARIVGSGGGQITGTGTIIGTPDYMAPEQAQGRADVDGRADVYALGVLVFQLLTGQLPFVADQPMGVVIQHLQAPVPSAHAVNPALPPQVDGLLQRALAKSPAARLSTAGALVDGLASMLAAAPAARTARTIVLEPRVATATPTPTPTEQQRVVTAVYVDVAEYAELVEERDGAEAARDALAALWERGRAVVADHGGDILARRERDATALWGAAVAREDDAERAVRAALAIRAELRHLAQGQPPTDDPPPVSIGVHTGSVLITLGDLTTPLAASGGALTVVERLAERAEGAVRISHDTYRQVRGVFDMQPNAPLRLRGRAEALATYAVSAAKARAFRVRARGVEGLEPPLLGREAELRVLQDAYLTAVEEGETQAVLLVGAAGLGKSRLIDAFDQWAELRPETYRIFRAEPTEATRQRPYALLRALLSFRFAILDDDPLPVVREKLERGVEELLGAPDHATAQLVGYLAGFDLRDAPHVSGLIGDPPQLAALARRRFYDFIGRVSASRPVVMLLDDLHHADDASLDLLDGLVEDGDRPLLMLLAARPALLERRSAWADTGCPYRQITIDPLQLRASRELARALLSPLGEPPRRLRDWLVERAAGNPLFLEELVRTLLDERVLVREADDRWRLEEGRLGGLRVPMTLYGLLQARIDALLAPERLTLQRAAAMGRVFFDGALAALDAADDAHLAEPAAPLAALLRRGLIERQVGSSLAGVTEYVFTQTLVRDLLYETLLERQRRAYHRAFAAWLGASERAEEYGPLIAEHYERGGEWARAATALARAGERALLVSDFATAQALLTRALDLAPGADTWPIRLQRAEVAMRQGDLAGARGDITAALADAHSDRARATGLALLGELESLAGAYAAARELLEQALPLVRHSDEPAALARTLYALGDVSLRLGVLKAAQAYLDESLLIAQRIGDITRELFALNRIGIIFLHQNRLEEATALYQAVHDRALEVGSRERAMHALNNLGVCAEMKGDILTALSSIRRALDLARELAMRAYVALYITNVAELELRLGRPAVARPLLLEGLALARELGAAIQQVNGVYRFGMICAAEGDIARALELFGVAQHHPAFSLDDQRQIDWALGEYQIDPDVAADGLARGAALDFATTVETLLQQPQRA